jgi:hypothetical protein
VVDIAYDIVLKANFLDRMVSYFRIVLSFIKKMGVMGKVFSFALLTFINPVT